MKKMLASTVLAISAIALCAPAFAQDADGSNSERRSTGGHSKEAFVASYDADGDGKVTREEFMAERAEIHKGYDMDGDGVITQLEYVEDYQYRLDTELAERRARNLRQAHVRFGILDADDNADLTLGELNESGIRTFSRLDSNEDGVIDDADTADSF